MIHYNPKVGLASSSHVQPAGHWQVVAVDGGNGRVHSRHLLHRTGGVGGAMEVSNVVHSLLGFVLSLFLVFGPTRRMTGGGKDASNGAGW